MAVEPMSTTQVKRLPPLIKLADLGPVLGYEQSAMYRMIKAGTFPDELELVKVGRTRYVRRADLLAFMGIS